MVTDRTRLPRLGRARLSLRHHSGVRSRIDSDLTSPVRERRIVLEFDRALLTGHYPCSAADHTAQLRVDAQGWGPIRSVFDDDALPAFIRAAYTRYARSHGTPGTLPAQIEAVRLLTEAKSLCASRARGKEADSHENCAGWAGESAERALDLLAEVDSPALRLLFDTGNGVAHGYRAPETLRALVAHVAHVHVKDAVTGPGGEVGHVLPGTGEAGVAACLDLLAEHGYAGALSIEPHLHLRPHLRASGADPGRGDRAAFVAYGHELERLMAGQWYAMSAPRSAEGVRGARPSRPTTAPSWPTRPFGPAPARSTRSRAAAPGEGPAARPCPLGTIPLPVTPPTSHSGTGSGTSAGEARPVARRSSAGAARFGAQARSRRGGVGPWAGQDRVPTVEAGPSGRPLRRSTGP
ncbi:MULTISPECIES: sugar phosphate isomerase/epimerase [unclassified Nocardiopsis]|uniref:sugar phosphate isomerase/epimerase family protein n=1 Tax=unclassified Nocardiopsis TaxID=2649073 RepID=UPI001F5B511A|nr:TIM barrel protein [Nocardiopsis sp. TSRI0078]